jgi:signal peptidase
LDHLLERPRAATLRRALCVAGCAVFVAAVAAWAVLLRPDFLGGPATYVIVSGHSMEPTLRTADLAVMLRRGSYRRGDVIAYRIRRGQPGGGARVIHRIVGGSATLGYITQGDNRGYRDPWRPTPSDIEGTLALRVPRLGLLPVFAHTMLGMAVMGALAAFVLVLGTRAR